jgi:hypothetical protein
VLASEALEIKGLRHISYLAFSIAYIASRIWRIVGRIRRFFQQISPLQSAIGGSPVKMIARIVWRTSSDVQRWM